MKLFSGKKCWGLHSSSARLSDDRLKEFYCIWKLVIWDWTLEY